MSEKKICILVGKKKLRNGLWQISYSSLDFYEKYGTKYSEWGTTVTKNTCPEIEELRVGDIIEVTLDYPKVVLVEKYKGEKQEPKVQVKASTLEMWLSYLEDMENACENQYMSAVLNYINMMRKEINYILERGIDE
ncbi:hypothetical protein J7L81_03440 [Candidatus Aerophobetes bacterium]|nr:hypothetical protein [Candidatus Aerophobetes bacterium]